MSDCAEEGILFLQLVVLFKMKKKKKRKRKKCVRELVRKREEKEAIDNLIHEIKLANRESFLRQDFILLMNIRFICDFFAISLLSYIHSSSC